MLIFIDESGDVGFKTDSGSSSHFVIVLIIFDDNLDAEETALKIKRLKRKLGKSEKFEFKFNKCNKELRLAFLNVVKDCHFRIRATVFSKNIINDKELRSSKNAFYNFALKNSLKYDDYSIEKARIVLDGSGDNSFKQNLINYLRASLNSKKKQVIKTLKIKDSKKDLLIQLADMIAGSIRKSYDLLAKDKNLYRNMIKKREEGVRECKF